MTRRIPGAATLLLCIGLNPLRAALPAPSAPTDPHSFGRPAEIAVRHLDLDLTVDFAARRLAGSATLSVERRDPAATTLRLDTRDLEISAVHLDGSSSAAPFQLAPAVPIFGQELTIALPPGAKTVRIDYRTRPEAAALQWLTPAQTAGGKQPFLFTQSQAILARTWVPCQDSPGVRMTYSATIHVPKELLALMSATNPKVRSGDGIYRFEMTHPIPSYLLALAVGDLEFRSLGTRSGVYAEPAMVGKAAWELADTEKMIAAAEKLYGPYRWERYDILVLPPSFPFGGMENPRLTFATPTILAGDRSLVSLVAHELAHSWSGNLVTNATWNDFWLNEGFTNYFESRIMEAVYGRDFSEMQAQLSRRELEEFVREVGPDNRDTWLALDLAGRDPDDAPGVPTGIAEPSSPAFARVDAELARLAAGTPPRELATAGWVTQQWQQLLRNLPPPQPVAAARLAELDNAFHFTDSGNAEILSDWFQRAIAAGYKPAYPALERFLLTVGRRKFIGPLYAALAKTPEGLAFAREIYARARPGYHPLAQLSIDALLNPPEAPKT